MTTITLCNIPRTSIYKPSPAIATLKSILEKNNIICSTVDVNILLYNYFKKENHTEYKILDSYFQTDLRYITQSKYDIKDLLSQIETLPNDIKKLYKKFLSKIVKIIISKKSDWVGISLLSVNSILPCIDLCKQLKKHNVKIILGGPGISTFGILGESNFGELMIKNNLANHYLAGEGELSLLNFLKGNTYKNKELENLDDFPYPNYSDTDFEQYESKFPSVYITASRGCVRNCSFCDIHSAWNKYKFRSGKNVADEIISHHKNHNCIDYAFTDSLINGNLKMFEEMMSSLISAFDNKILSNKITLSGQFICRTKKSFPERWYDLMQRSHISQLQIGIETGSESVMKDIGKRLKISDIDFTMEMMLKYEIQCDMLMIVGYPTETLEDFKQTIDMIKRYKKYSDAGVISGINLGKTMVILPGSPIGKNLQHWGIEYDEDENWISSLNPDLTMYERIRRRIVLHELCQDLGYLIRWPMTTLNTLEKTMNKSKTETI